MRSSEFIHPSLVKYAGSEATIVGLPSHPITWYTVKFHDGKEVKLRSSSFDILGYEVKHSTQQFKAAMVKQQQQMEQMRAVQHQQHQQHQQQQAMMAASHSAMTSATSSSAASSVPSPVPHQLLNHGQAMSHPSARSVTPTPQVHSSHHSPHPINTASMLPPMSAQAAAVASMQQQQQQQQQQHAAQQQSHKAQVKQAIKKEPKMEMMNGAVQAVTAAAVPAHTTSMNGASNSQLTLNIPHHMNGSSSASASAAAASASASSHSQQPKMAATVNPLTMNPLFSALSSLQSSFNPSPAAAAAMPFLSPFALQSFFAQATPYDAAIMAAALRANGFPIPMSTMSGLAAMQQMAVQAQAQAANQQQHQHQQQQQQQQHHQQQQQQAAVVVPHLTIPHQPQLQHNGNSTINHANSNNSQQPQPTANNHNAVPAAAPPSYNGSKHGRPNSGASMNGTGSHSSGSNQSTQPTITITPTASGVAHQPGSFSIHSALPSPLASPLHLNTADILPSPRLPMPDLFFSPPPTSTSMSHSMSLGHQFSLPSSFLHPFSNPPSALTSPTAHTPIVPFDGVIGDISSPHGTMLATAPHTSTHHHHAHHISKRGHDDLLSVPHGRLGVAVEGMGLGLGMGVGMGGGVYDSVEMLLPLFTPTNASFERLLADTDNKPDSSKRIRID